MAPIQQNGIATNMIMVIAEAIAIGFEDIIHAANVGTNNFSNTTGKARINNIKLNATTIANKISNT